MTSHLHPVADLDLERYYALDEHDQNLHDFQACDATPLRDWTARQGGHGFASSSSWEGDEANSDPVPPSPPAGSETPCVGNARPSRQPDADRPPAGVGSEDFAHDVQRALTLIREAEEAVPAMHPNVELLVGTDLRGARARLGSVLAHLRREGIAA